MLKRSLAAALITVMLLCLYTGAFAAESEQGQGEAEEIRCINVELFNYNADSTAADADAVGSAIAALYPDRQRSAYFSFRGDGASSDEFSMLSKWTGINGGVLRGLTAASLTADGQLQYADGICGIDLFDTQSGDYDVYTNVSFPFVLGENGLYGYDSTSASALYNAETNSITLSEPNDGFWPFGYNKYHFGMHMSVEFYLPSGKQAEDSDLVFHFAGDDDVWVFVDGVLVLDIGGIHDTYSGSINFTDGEVVSPKYYGTYSGGTSSFGSSGSSWTQTSEYITQLAEQSLHTLDIFYLERGAGESNCQIEFNMPEYDSLSLEKTVTGASDEAQCLYDGDFDFLLRTAASADDELALYSGSYVVQQDGEAPVAKTTADGSFSLKAGQTAVFEDVLIDSVFSFTEVRGDDFSDYFDSGGWEYTNNLCSDSQTVLSGTLTPDGSAQRSYSFVNDSVYSYVPEAAPLLGFTLGGSPTGGGSSGMTDGDAQGAADGVALGEQPALIPNTDGASPRLMFWCFTFAASLAAGAVLLYAACSGISYIRAKNPKRG